MVSERGYRQPENYQDTIAVLHEEEVLEQELAERLKEWVGFRNVLVHLYVGIDHRRSYEAIEQRLGDLEAFAARIGRLLAD